MTIPAQAGVESISDALALAFDAADAPEGDTIPVVETEAAAPKAGEQAPAVVPDQPAEDQESSEPADNEDIFAILDEGDGAPDPLGQEFEIEGFDRPLTVAEMKAELEGDRLRQADYTRKTQALAEQRKSFKDESTQALNLFNQLQQDPAATIAFLAEQMGLVEKGALGQDVTRVRSTWEPPLTGEALETEIESRVEARLAEHPTVVEAQQQTLVNKVNQDFADIEQKYGVTLSDQARFRMLGAAQEAGTSNLELVFQAMQAQASAKRQAAERAKAAATSRPGTRPSESDTPAEIETLKDAFDLAWEGQEQAS